MTNYLIRCAGVIFILTCCVSSCTDGAKHDNQLTEREKKEGWVLLFDGSSTKGWHLYNNAKDASTWTVKNGELICGPDIRYIHLDLVSDKEYKNFDLRLDWKINKGGNSGVFINVVERPDIQAAWASGPEYQILEKSHPDYEKADKRPGGFFGFAQEQKDTVHINPFTEWNESRIRQQDGHVEFYLNGVLTAQRDLNSQGWIDSIGKTYFNSFPEYGRHISGHIALQDWQKAISFKNIRIREL